MPRHAVRCTITFDEQLQIETVPYNPMISELRNHNIQFGRASSIASHTWCRDRITYLTQISNDEWARQYAAHVLHFPAYHYDHDPYTAVCVGQAKRPGPVDFQPAAQVTGSIPEASPTMAHVTRNIHGTRHNLNTLIRHKHTYYSVQETDINECYVNEVKQQAVAAGSEAAKWRSRTNLERR